MACSRHITCWFAPGIIHWPWLQAWSGLLFCFCLLGFHTLAVAADNKPNAGGLLRDMPLSPGGNDKNQDVKGLDNPGETELSESEAFEVSKLLISGNTVFATEQLHALVKSLEGTSLTLVQLEKGIEEITNLYRSSGYPLARALIPEQVIEDGVIQVFVLEAVWGDVQVFNSSEVLDRVIERVVFELQPGQQVQQQQLDKVSLMLSDIPGVDPHFSLKPGQVTGATDLEVLAQPTTPLGVEMLYDNQGSKYTGRERMSLGMQWNNPFRHGDVVGINLLTTGELMNYKRISFETPLAFPGGLAGAAVSDLNYTLGDIAASTNASGSAKQNSIWGRYQLQRSQNSNLALRIQLDRMELQDHQGGDTTKTDRTINAVNVTLNADNSDLWMGGGRSMWNAGLTSGKLVFDDASAEAVDDKSAKHKGDFQRINFSASRQQFIRPTTTLALNTDSQWAFTNLDSSQKFSLGGPRSVRAYEAGTLSGDGGLFVSAELRELLPAPAAYLNVKGQWFASVFIEAARAKINQRPWDTGKNEESLSGVGLGFNWLGPDNWRASLSWGHPLESVPSAYVRSKRVNAWFELAKGFR